VLARSILAALEDAGMVVVQGWQDIASAPRDNNTFIGFDERDGVYPCRGLQIGSEVYFENLAWVDRDGDYQTACPTHWMPLPTPPIQAGRV
jgi:hypothetical protein